MKVLRPTLRENVRYVAFDVISEEVIKAQDLKNEILSSTTSLFGDLGLTNIRIELISFMRQKGLLRCSHTSTEDARTVLATLYKVKSSRVSARVLGVSGTIAGAKKKYLQVEKKLKHNASFNITKPISGTAVRICDSEIDIVPDDNKVTDRSDVGLVGITIKDNKELI
jgi:ribonuclease P/MRP protein subunit POP5